jgi:HEAT repeat protein
MLKSVKAVPKLKQQLPISSGYTKVAIARALWNIEQHPESLAVIASVLAGDAKSTSKYDQIDAAWALRDIHQPEAITALANALFDEEHLVRSNAAEALAANRGRRVSERVLDAVRAGDKEKIARLAARLVSDRPTPRARRSRSTPPRTGQ